MNRRGEHASWRLRDSLFSNQPNAGWSKQLKHLNKLKHIGKYHLYCNRHFWNIYCDFFFKRFNMLREDMNGAASAGHHRDETRTQNCLISYILKRSSSHSSSSSSSAILSSKSFSKLVLVGTVRTSIAISSSIALMCSSRALTTQDFALLRYSDRSHSLIS